MQVGTQPGEAPEVVLVDDEFPRTSARLGRAEVAIIESEDRKTTPIGYRHHAGVNQSETEIVVAFIEGRRLGEQARRHERDRVRAYRELVQESPRTVGSIPEPDHLLRFNHDRHRDHHAWAQGDDR